MGASLTRTAGTPTSKKKFTFSFWYKKTTVRDYGASTSDGCFFNSAVSNDNRLTFMINQENSPYDQVRLVGRNSGSQILDLRTNAQLRDPGAWYHIVAKVDTTQNTNTDRAKLYINGTEQTLDTSSYPNQDVELQIQHNPYLLSYSGSGNYVEGLITHYHYTDGYAYDASTFGSTDATTGQWKINTSPSVTYGTNGFFLFKDNAAVTDQSGNSNNFTLSGTLTPTEDNPSNNFCTFNALLPQSNTGLSKGNTRFETTSGSGWKAMCGTLGMAKNSGKYYMEFKHLGGSYNGYGIADSKSSGIVDQINKSESTYPGEAANSYGYLSQGELHYNASQTGTGWDSYTTNDIIGMAVDMDNMKLYYHKNGTYLQSANPSTGTNGYSINDPVGAYFPTATVNAGIMCANFGNGNFDGTAISSEGTNASGIGKFEYDVPTGYTALSTKGLNE